MTDLYPRLSINLARKQEIVNYIVKMFSQCVVTSITNAVAEDIVDLLVATNAHKDLSTEGFHPTEDGLRKLNRYMEIEANMQTLVYTEKHHKTALILKAAIANKDTEILKLSQTKHVSTDLISSSFACLPVSSLLLHIPTLGVSPIVVNIADEAELRFSGGLRGAFFALSNDYAPSTPECYLETVEIRTGKVVCTYITTSDASRLRLMRATAVTNFTGSSFAISGVWFDGSAIEYNGALVIDKFLESYLPKGDRQDNVVVVEFSYKESCFIKR